MLNMSTNKIVMIPTSLSAGFAVSLIPYITKTYEEGRLDEMHRQIRTSIGVLMFITVPASIGIMALAQPLFTVFYGYDPIVHGHDLTLTEVVYYSTIRQLRYLFHYLV